LHFVALAQGGLSPATQHLPPARIPRKDNGKVEIRLEAESTTATEIRIRVGWLGNEALSNVILKKIKQHL